MGVSPPFLYSYSNLEYEYRCAEYDFGSVLD